MRRSDYKTNAENNFGKEPKKEPYHFDIYKEIRGQEDANPATPAVNEEPVVQQSPENKELVNSLLITIKHRQEIENGTIVTEKPEKKKGKKGWIIAIIIAVLLIGATVVTVFVWKPWETQSEVPVETVQPTKPVETTVEVPATEKELLVPLIEEDITSIFANAERSDVVDECSMQWVQTMYGRVSDAEMNGEDVSDVRTKIQTIELFLQHKRTLEELDNEEQPLNAGVMETVQGIKVATELYYESGLKNTISLKCQGILDDYDLYSSLKAELEAITDYATYDIVAGTAKVNLIKHKPNRDELNVMIEIVSSNQDLINAELAIAELADSEDEEAKTAANNAKAAVEDTIASLKIKLQKAHALVEGEEFVEPTTEVIAEPTEATESPTEESSESTENNEEGNSEP